MVARSATAARPERMAGSSSSSAARRATNARQDYERRAAARRQESAAGSGSSSGEEDTFSWVEPWLDGLKSGYSRFAPHFDFIGNFDTHYGIFDGCGKSLPFTTADKAPGACC